MASSLQILATKAQAGPQRLAEAAAALGIELENGEVTVIVEARFRLVESTPERTLAAAERYLSGRGERQPQGATAGCTFRNPPVGPPAGALLERAGCKGLRVGDARVSDRHANFIVNEGSQNASDVLELIEEMKRRVRDAFGVDLAEEIVVYA
jgi:UDP-N-acetylenolpyruvoylglucosamine reductase